MTMFFLVFFSTSNVTCAFFSCHNNRLILGEAVTNETIEDSTIKVYPDLTSK